MISEFSPEGEMCVGVPSAAERTVSSTLRRNAVILCMVLFGVLFSWLVVERTDRKMRDDLLYQTRLGAQTIDLDQVRALSGADEDVEKEEYHSLRRRLSAFREAADCRYVYLMQRRPVRDNPGATEVVFLVEAQNDGIETSPPSQPGDVYEEEYITEEFAALFDGGAPFVEGPVEDEWGIWVSALVPMVDHRTGKLLAVLGVDYDAKLWRWTVVSSSLLPVSLMLVLLLICIALFVLSRPVDPMPRPVLKRLLPTMAVALLLLSSAAVLLLWRTYSDNLDERLNSLHASISAEFHLDLKNELSLMESSIASLAEAPRLQWALFAGDADALFSDWLSMFARLRREYGVRSFSFANEEFRRLYSFAPGSDEKLFYDGPVVLKAKETGKIASGVEVCPSGNLVLRAVLPVSRAGELVGYAIITKDVQGLLQKRSLRSGSHLALSLRKGLLDRAKWEKTCNPDRKTEWEQFPDCVIVFSSMERLPPGIFSSGEDDAPDTFQERRRESVFGEKIWGVSVLSFEDVSGESVGEFAIMTDITADRNHLRSQVAMMWGIGGTIAAALLILLFTLLRRVDAGILAQQKALRESDALLKKLSRQIPGVLYQYRQEPGGPIGLLFVSDNLTDVCGLEPDEVIRDIGSFFALVHPEDREGLEERLAASSRTMEVWEHEFRVVLPEKGERWLFTIGNPERLPDGSVLMHGYVVDSTERREREDEVRSQAGLIASLLNSIPDIIFYKNAGGVFLGCNRPHEEMTGRSESETVGKTDYDFYDRGIADFYREKDKEALAAERPLHNEEWVTYPDGRRALLDTLKTSFRGKDGELIGLLGISRDITERKRMEEDLRAALEAANAASLAKSAFLASMSHEIRTPMNAILGFSQLLERDPELAPKHMKYVRIINRSGEHLLALINDILDMAKIESGRMTLNRAPFSPFAMLRDIVSLFHTLAEEKSLSLTIEHDDDLRAATLLGDEGKLRQVLVNLVGNGLKFTQQGSVTVRFRTETDFRDASSDERELLLSVEVEDSGVGISPEQIELIFAPFQQSDSGKKAGGTGLGLTISRKFVEMMGGTLTCESELGKGSCFRFRIPVERVYDVSLRPSQPGGRVLGLKPESGRPLILIADDDDTSRGLLTELLTEAGFDCAEAANGLQAVELCASRTPDAVLMDMNMPLLDGYEATRMIKESDSRNIPVIALTADAFARDAVAACGADEYLRKPFVADELFAVLQTVLGLEYIYEDVSGRDTAGGEAGSEAGGPGSPKAIDLSLIPGNLLRELHGAVEDGDMYRIRELIRSISAVDEKVGKELLLLAERYDYERLLELVNDEGGLSDGE